VFQLDHLQPIFKSFPVHYLPITAPFVTSRDSSVGLVTGLRAGRPGTCFSTAGGFKGIVPFFKVSRPAVRLAQP